MNLKALTTNIVASDVNEGIEFYKNVLGFEIVLANPEAGEFEFAMFKLDSVTIILQSLPSFISAFPQYMDTPLGGMVMLYIDVYDLQTIHDRVVKNKVDIFVAINTTFMVPGNSQLQARTGTF